MGAKLGLQVEIRHLENPRVEPEEHYYNPDHQHLLNLGYEPTHGVEAEMRSMLEDLMKYRDRIDAKRDLLIPDIRWNGTKQKSKYLD